ncbi:MAG: HAD family phosphatase [Candidatus Methylacidiphilales bacterium]
MRISTIIFDLGKVLIDFDYSIALHRVAQRSELTRDEIDELAYRDHSRLVEYERGLLTTEAFFEAQREAFRFTGSAGELQEIWCDIFAPIEAHIRMARCLAEFYPLGLMSNISEAHVAFLEQRHDFFSIFREKIYSCRVGSVKPDREIYYHALERLGADRFETLFIDDLEANVMEASRMGWQTIHLRPDVSLQQALQSYDLRGV